MSTLGRGRHVKQYELDDGTFITIKDMQDKGFSKNTAYCRLQRTRDPIKVFASPLNNWQLDDGTVWTVDSLATYLECSRSTAWKRLHTSTDPAVVFADVGQSTNGKVVDRRTATSLANSRMYGDPEGFWKIFNNI